jgi:hypothetical protein
MIAKRVAYAVGVLVIVSSGTYLFVYLYRWEWNRALIAGVIFVAAEIALAAMLVFEKLAELGSKIDEVRTERGTLDVIKETAPPPKARFRWLTGQGGDLKVFVPVLMGAGILFSAIAWMLERLARATAKPALEQGLAARLQPLALPEGGFLSPVESATLIPGARRLRFKTLFYVLVSAAGLFMAIDALGDLTQNRPDPGVSLGSTSAITLEVTREGWTRSEKEAVRSLWRACLHTVSPAFHADDFVDRGNGIVTMFISPAPGESAERRLRGCLQDATLDNVLARVVSFRPVSY